MKFAEYIFNVFNYNNEHGTKIPDLYLVTAHIGEVKDIDRREAELFIGFKYSELVKAFNAEGMTKEKFMSQVDALKFEYDEKLKEYNEKLKEYEESKK